MQVTITAAATSAGRANMAHGTFDTPDPAVLVTVTLGFRPRAIRLINATTPTVLEKTASMPAGATFRQVAAGTGTVQTDHVTITEDGFTLAAAAAGAAQTWHFTAHD